MENYIYSTVSALLFLAIGLVVLYLRGRIQNLATRHDVEQLTRTTESVKKEFVDKTEELKANLSLVTQHRLNIKKEERDALITFNKNISAWIFYITRFSFSNYKLSNYEELNRVRVELARRQYECDISEANINMFSNDDTILEVIKEVNLSIIQYERVLSSSVADIYWTYRNNAAIILNSDPIESVVRTSELEKDIAKLAGDYGNKIIDKYKEVSAVHAKFMKIAKKRIKKLEEE